MKNSGIEWIGEIPEHWGKCKIKRYCLEVFPGATPQSTNPLYWDGDINWIPSGSCHDCRIDSAPKTITQEGFENSSTKMIPANTALVAMTGATCGNTGYLTISSCANQSVTAYIENKSVCDSLFLWYVLRAAKEHLLTFQTGGAQGGVNVENCKNIFVPYVPLPEQRAISAYLDRQCALIDSVTEKTKASIEEYKKLRQAVITQAVTKGVRGDRPMKDSGIEWIGEIPECWSIIRKLSHVVTEGISYGIVKLFDPDDEHGIKVIRCSDVREGVIIPDNIRTVTKEVSNEYKRTLLNGGEVLVNVRGTLGGCAVVPDEMSGYNIAREVAKIALNNTIYNRYVMYYLLSNCFTDYRTRYLSGSVYIGLNIEMLSSFSLSYPSMNEQVEIVAYLDKKCAEIDALITKKETFLSELEAYKKSLIYEYVTGKKEVPQA